MRIGDSSVDRSRRAAAPPTSAPAARRRARAFRYPSAQRHRRRHRCRHWHDLCSCPSCLHHARRAATLFPNCADARKRAYAFCCPSARRHHRRRQQQPPLKDGLSQRRPQPPTPLPGEPANDATATAPQFPRLRPGAAGSSLPAPSATTRRRNRGGRVGGGGRSGGNGSSGLDDGQTGRWRSRRRRRWGW